MTNSLKKDSNLENDLNMNDLSPGEKDVSEKKLNVEEALVAQPESVSDDDNKLED